MDSLSYKTKSANSATVKKDWYIIDAENQVVGRIASQLAKVIRGKNKASFTPHVDCGDKVIVLNADKVRFTGNKIRDKKYLTFTGYPGGQKSTSATEMFEKHPTRVLYNAVKGMLPKNRLQKDYLKNLILIEGAEHNHGAQKPQQLELNP